MRTHAVCVVHGCTRPVQDYACARLLSACMCAAALYLLKPTIPSSLSPRPLSPLAAWTWCHLSFWCRSECGCACLCVCLCMAVRALHVRKTLRVLAQISHMTERACACLCMAGCTRPVQYYACARLLLSCICAAALHLRANPHIPSCLFPRPFNPPAAWI